MSESYKKLVKTLQTIFEMDKADLDFGIYRIMNQKRDDINKFLEDDLLPQVKQAFDDYSSEGQGDLQQELSTAIEQAKNLGAPDPENVPTVLEIKAKMANSVDATALENDVFSKLHTFFSRYYDQGDFISQRRYKADTYAIPYQGEEVKLYWANHDQYYIKSSEHLRDYAFLANDDKKSVRIKLMEADTEKDNIKAKAGEERRFVLDEECPLSEEDGELLIHFNFIPVGKKKQDKLNEAAVETVLAQEGFDEWLDILKALAPTEAKPKRTLLERHLNEYTARNTFDYFIHKDLGGFLNRELDFFIKNEVLFLDDIDDAAFSVTEQQLRKIKIIRSIAKKVIRMLVQLEDFQKKIWLKKKFVVETNYCITLDRIPFDEKLFEGIFSNEEQLAEWEELFSIDRKQLGRDYDSMEWDKFLSLDYIRLLSIDTKYFDDEFKLEIEKDMNDLSEDVDGQLIHSDSFQGLRKVSQEYIGKAKCIYIDPPYNTGSDEFLYKDRFESSSWLSMLRDRLFLAKDLLSECGSIAVSIDDNELKNALEILNLVFGAENKVSVIAVKMSRATGVKMAHEDQKPVRYKEYLLIYCKNKNEFGVNPQYIETDEIDSRYGKYIQNIADESEDWIVVNISSKIKDIKDNKEKLLKFYRENANSIIRLAANDQDIFKNTKGNKNFQKVTTARGLEKHAYDGQKVLFYSSKLKNIGGELLFGENSGDYWSDIVDHVNDLSNEGGVTLANGKKPEFLIQRIIELLTQERDLILDFCLGSGTSAAVAHKLNRRFIGIEQMPYFYNLPLIRLKNVFNGELRGISKKIGWQGGGSLKYMFLEGYEDALNNLDLVSAQPNRDFLKDNKSLKEDYMLNYWLDIETADSSSLLNIEQFEDPFNYKLNIGSGSVGATKPTTVDLVETFNYLIGLTVKTIDVLKGFKLITGTNPQGETVLVVWRNIKESDNDALETFLDKQGYNPRDTEFDHIYVNGDHTLEDPQSKVKMTEIEFKRLMFDVSDV